MSRDNFDRGFGEEDRVNCPFYYKIGSCRNGDRCNRMHNRPTMSATLLLPHLYPGTPDTLLVSNDEDWDDETYNKAQEHMEVFYEEVFLELANYGEVEDMAVCDNVSEHMVGNVYVKYVREEDAEKAMISLPTRFYGSRLITAEYSPVPNLSEARCRAFHETRCSRGGLCNFMHIKHCPKALKRRCVRLMHEEHPEFQGKKERSRSRSREKEKKVKRMPSEERKAMIAEWNKERLSAITPPPPPMGVGVPPPPGAPKTIAPPPPPIGALPKSTMPAGIVVPPPAAP